MGYLWLFHLIFIIYIYMHLIIYIYIHEYIHIYMHICIVLSCSQRVDTMTPMPLRHQIKAATLGTFTCRPSPWQRSNFKKHVVLLTVDGRDPAPLGVNEALSTTQLVLGFRPFFWGAPRGFTMNISKISFDDLTTRDGFLAKLYESFAKYIWLGSLHEIGNGVEALSRCHLLNSSQTAPIQQEKLD